MGAIEPARQAGSTDTKLGQQLDHDGFAVGSLFITRCLYFMTGPKFVVPILGIVQQKRNSKNLIKKYPNVKLEKRNITSFLIYD